MAKVILIAVSAVLACYIGASVVNGAGEVCTILSSTTRIIKKLCYADGGVNKNNQTLINDFFACYDTAPGKPLFEKCQIRAFGGILNNPKDVTASCANQLNLARYLPCLRTEFRNAGLDMNKAVLTLNACQSKVLGVPFTRMGCKLDGSLF